MSKTISTRVLNATLLIASQTFDVRPADILGRGRIRQIAYGRHYAMWLLRELGYSFPEIGRNLGVDHSTVIFGVRGHARRLEEADRYPQLVAKYVDKCLGFGGRGCNGSQVERILSA